MSTQKLLSISEAAEMLGVSIDTLRRWDKAGILTSVRPNGKNRFFALEDLEKVKQEQPLSISQAAAELNLSQSTLRRLEKKGLIKPERNKNGERIYTRKALETFVGNHQYTVHQAEPLTVPEQNEVVSVPAPTESPPVPPPIQAIEETISQPMEALAESVEENTRAYDGVTTGVRDFVLFRLFFGILTLGMGILYILRFFNIVFDGVFPLGAQFGPASYLLPVGLIVAGSLTLLTSVFQRSLKSVHHVVYLFTMVVLAGVVYVAYVSGYYGGCIIAAALMFILLFDLLRGCATCLDRGTAYGEFVVFTALLLGLTALLEANLGSVLPWDALLSQLSINPVMSVVVLLIAVPLMFLLLTPLARLIKADILFLMASAVIAFACATIFSIQSRWNLAFFCYTYSIFSLFLLWWKYAREKIDGRVFYITVFSFVWIGVAVIGSLVALSTLQEKIKDSTLGQMRQRISKDVTSINVFFEKTGPTIISTTANSEVRTAIKDKKTEVATDVAQSLFNKIPYVQKVVIYDPAGNVIGEYPRRSREASVNVRHEEYFDRTLSEVRGLTTSVVDSSGQPTIIQTQPLIAEQKVAGIITVSYDLQSLTSNYKIGEREENIFAIDDRGVYALHADTNFIGTPAPESLTNVSTSLYKGTSLLRVNDYAKTPRWRVYIEQPTKQLFEQMANLNAIASLFIIVNSVLSLGAGFVLAKRGI